MSKLRGLARTEFPLAVKKAAFARACKPDGMPKCEAPGCGRIIRAGHLRYEHIQPDGLGGEPTLQNCGVWCDVCADRKTFTEDNPRMQKADRVLKATFGLQRSKRKIQSRGFEKRPPQSNASRPLQKWRPDAVEQN